MLPEEMKAIADICRKRGIYLITDEIYRWLNYRDPKNISVSRIDQCKEYILVIDGFSKSYAMTGWRLGYAIAPKEIIDKMQLLLETLCSCVPRFIQSAGMEALTGVQDSVIRMREIYDRRRKLLVDGLNRIPGISCQELPRRVLCISEYRKNRADGSGVCQKTVGGRKSRSRARTGFWHGRQRACTFVLCNG